MENPQQEWATSRDHFNSKACDSLSHKGSLNQGLLERTFSLIFILGTVLQVNDKHPMLEAKSADRLYMRTLQRGYFAWLTDTEQNAELFGQRSRYFWESRGKCDGSKGQVIQPLRVQDMFCSSFRNGSWVSLLSPSSVQFYHLAIYIYLRKFLGGTVMEISYLISSIILFIPFMSSL